MTRVLTAVLVLGAVSAGAAAPQRMVTIPAADGGPVQADLYGSGSRGVVLAHGGRFDRSSWRPQAQALAGAGFQVLALDFRAAVESRQGRETPCLYDEACLAKDVLAAVRYLRREGVISVAVVGGSLGGAAAARAAADAAPGEIDRVVLIAHMLVKAPERIKGPKLFVVSRDDLGSGDVPRLPGIRAQFEKAPEPKELVVLDGAAHAQFIFETPQGPELMRVLTRFLDAEQATGAARVREPVVGLPCEGCEAVFEGLPPVASIPANGRIAPAGEPGAPMVIEGVVRDARGRPAPGVVIYAYQTDATGIYPADARPPGPASRRHGRLRGWVKTDANGRYRFDTIRPAGYPNTDIPEHVHLHVLEIGRGTYYIDDVLFMDDPRLTAAQRKSLAPGRGGNGIVTPTRDASGTWRVIRDVVLGERIPGYPR